MVVFLLSSPVVYWAPTDLGNSSFSVKDMSFPVAMYGYGNWTLKKAAAAVAAKSLQSCPTLYDPIDSSPPGSPIPGILQARTLEWIAFPSPMHENEK